MVDLITLSLFAVTALAVLIVLRVIRPARRPIRNFNPQRQAVICEETQCWRSTERATLMTTLEDAKVVFDFFLKGKRERPEAPCLGMRPARGAPFVWKTYSQVYEEALHLGAGLNSLGVAQKDFFSIWLENCIEWMLLDLACQSRGIVSAPPYATMDVDTAAAVIKMAGSKVLCVGEKQARNLEPRHLGAVEVIVVVGKITALKEETRNSAKKIITFGDLLRLGQDNPSPLPVVAPNDLVTVCFTSGTTGMPKGAMLSNANVVATAGAGDLRTQSVTVIDTVHFSYLPLAHMLERIIFLTCFRIGARIGFWGGEVPQLFDDMAELKPTFMLGVPRVFNRLYEGVLTSVRQQGGVKKLLFDYAYGTKRDAFISSGQLTHPLFDALVFRKIREKLGGRVRFLFTGSAPIDSEVMVFLSVCLSVPVLQGYGQTETSGGVCLANAYDPTMVTGHCGPTLACGEVKVIDVPEMQLEAKNGVGELLVRGANIFVGYLNDPQKTAEAIDKDGFLHTGDIARINDNGTITILDRKKSIFKLSQGEYISPENLESHYCRSRYLQQIFVTGTSTESTLVAIAVPNAASWKAGATMDQVCSDPEFKEAVLEDLKEIAKTSKFRGFERIVDVHFTPQEWTQDNGLMSVTGKPKRFELQKHFKKEIDQMYARLKGKNGD